MDLSFFAPYNSEVQRLVDQAQPFHFPLTLKLTPASFDMSATASQPVSVSSLSMKVPDLYAHKTALKSEF